MTDLDARQVSPSLFHPEGLFRLFGRRDFGIGPPAFEHAVLDGGTGGSQQHDYRHRHPTGLPGPKCQARNKPARPKATSAAPLMAVVRITKKSFR